MQESSKKVIYKASASAIAAIAALLLTPVQSHAVDVVMTAAAAASTEFDWSVNSGNGPNGSGNGGADGNYTPSPLLTDSNVNAVYAFLAQRAGNNFSNPASPLAVKIVTPISKATAQKIFNTFNVKYVFADFEGPNATPTPQDPTGSDIQKLVAQIHGFGSKSFGAYIGEFNLTPANGDDPTTPSHINNAPPSFKNVPEDGAYKPSGVNMANEAAYPGSADFLSKAQSGAPNIRSALFVLPIDRVTITTAFLASGKYTNTSVANQPVVTPGNYLNLPWISRFNNYGNDVLNNDGHNAADGTLPYKYAFNTNDVNHPEYKNQLLSANDFAAQVLHDRLRGAGGFNLFNYKGPQGQYSSVIGYSVGQEQIDGTKGWTANGNAVVDDIFKDNHYAFANLVNSVPILVTSHQNGKTIYTESDMSSIKTGMMLSGVYDTKNSKDEHHNLALLLSNLSGVAQTVDFNAKYAGASVDLADAGFGPLDQYYTIAPGTHQLLTFTLTNNEWVLNGNGMNEALFADTNRNGIGVPEPTSVAVLAIAGAGVLLRRRSRKV